jgi:lactate permease
MLGFRQSAATAGLAGWCMALLVAGTRFGAGPVLLVLAQGKALLFACHVLYIIWMALLFYHALRYSGAFEVISARLSGYVGDRSIQALLLACAFGGFLEAVSGFGVPSAIVAPMLVAAGYAPIASAVMVSIGEAWAVTFGSLGNALLAMATASHRPVATLAPASAVLLGIACFGGGLAVLWTIGGFAVARRNLGPYLAVVVVISAAQYGLALTPLLQLAALGAAFAGVLAAIAAGRFRASAVAPARPKSEGHADLMPLGLALLPYLLLVVIVMLTTLVAPLNQALNTVIIQFQFPEMKTSLGYVTPAGLGRTISIFGHTGALMGYTTALTLALFGWQRRLPSGLLRTLRAVGQATISQALPATAGIISMVAMAITMDHAGMTLALAQGVSQTAGLAYPLASPFIGALGAFMTGSNVNSNVLFTSLQQATAQILKLDPVLILAAQTTGGAVGGAFAPAKVILACSTVGLTGQEGKVLKAILVYGLAILSVVGLVTLAATALRL